MSTDAEDVVPLEHGRPELVELTDAGHLLLPDDVMRGLADIVASRAQGADAALAPLQRGRAHWPRR